MVDEFHTEKLNKKAKKRASILKIPQNRDNAEDEGRISRAKKRVSFAAHTEVRKYLIDSQKQGSRFDGSASDTENSVPSKSPKLKPTNRATLNSNKRRYSDISVAASSDRDVSLQYAVKNLRNDGICEPNVRRSPRLAARRALCDYLLNDSARQESASTMLLDFSLTHFDSESALGPQNKENINAASEFLYPTVEVETHDILPTKVGLSSSDDGNVKSDPEGLCKPSASVFNDKERKIPSNDYTLKSSLMFFEVSPEIKATNEVAKREVIVIEDGENKVNDYEVAGNARKTTIQNVSAADVNEKDNVNVFASDVGIRNNDNVAPAQDSEKDRYLNVFQGGGVQSEINVVTAHSSGESDTSVKILENGSKQRRKCTDELDKNAGDDVNHVFLLMDTDEEKVDVVACDKYDENGINSNCLQSEENKKAAFESLKNTKDDSITEFHENKRRIGDSSVILTSECGNKTEKTRFVEPVEAERYDKNLNILSCHEGNKTVVKTTTNLEKDLGPLEGEENDQVQIVKFAKNNDEGSAVKFSAVDIEQTPSNVRVFKEVNQEAAGVCDMSISTASASDSPVRETSSELLKELRNLNVCTTSRVLTDVKFRKKLIFEEADCCLGVDKPRVLDNVLQERNIKSKVPESGDALMQYEVSCESTQVCGNDAKKSVIFQEVPINNDEKMSHDDEPGAAQGENKFTLPIFYDATEVDSVLKNEHTPNSSFLAIENRVKNAQHNVSAVYDNLMSKSSWFIDKFSDLRIDSTNIAARSDSSLFVAALRGDENRVAYDDAQFTHDMDISERCVSHINEITEDAKSALNALESAFSVIGSFGIENSYEAPDTNIHESEYQSEAVGALKMLESCLDSGVGGLQSSIKQYQDRLFSSMNQRHQVAEQDFASLYVDIEDVSKTLLRRRDEMKNRYLEFHSISKENEALKELLGSMDKKNVSNRRIFDLENTCLQGLMSVQLIEEDVDSVRMTLLNNLISVKFQVSENDIAIVDISLPRGTTMESKFLGSLYSGISPCEDNRRTMYWLVTLCESIYLSKAAYNEIEEISDTCCPIELVTEPCIKIRFYAHNTIYIFSMVEIVLDLNVDYRIQISEFNVQPMMQVLCMEKICSLLKEYLEKLKNQPVNIPGLFIGIKNISESVKIEESDIIL